MRRCAAARLAALCAALLAARPAAAFDNGLGRTPPLGWSTWKTCGDAGCTHDLCTEEEVKRNAAALVSSGMRDLGYRYVNLDDCWAAQRRDAATQRLTWDAERFPSGMPALAGWLHDRGLLLGLYTSAGNETCSSGGRPIKPPGSRGHYDLDAATFAEWEVDYVKLDWCGDIKKQVLQGKKAHKDFARAMNASGRPMFLEVVAGYLFFVGPSIATVANSWRFCEDHKDTWEKTAEEITCRADLRAPGSPGGWASMDFLMTGGAGCPAAAHCPGMTDDEYRTEMAVWALTQSPLIVATDVTNLTAVMRQTLLNAELIAAHQRTDAPPGRRLSGTVGEVWGRRLDSAGAEWLVALVNVGPTPLTVSVEWGALGWDAGATAACRDLWAHADLPAATGSYSATVPTHGTALVKLTRQ